MKKLVVLSSVIGLALVGCAPKEVETIKIGFIGPLTGDANTYGLDTLHGAEIKVAEINAAGGINGSMIELITEDARCNGTDALSAAQKLINIDKVVVINGGQCSGETLALATAVESAKIPTMSPGSTSPDVTDAGDFVFRNIPSDGLAARATAQYLKDNDLLKIAIITENTDFATAFGESLISHMGEDSVVLNEKVEPGTKDFRTLMTRLQDVEFDAFIVNAQTTAVGGAMAIQFREQGLEQPMLTNNGVASSTLIELAGDAVEGMKVVLPPSEGANSAIFDAFVTTFRDQFGPAAAAMIYAANSYDVIGVFAEAIAEVGTDGEAIRNYLNNLEGYDGAIGRFSFDENGDVVGIDLELQEVQNGVFTKVEAIPLS